MRFFLIIIIPIFLISCTGNKFVYICGERECIDKKEADEYFSKNLSMEVIVLNKKEDKSINLVQLNTSTSNEILENEDESFIIKDIKNLTKKEKKIIQEERKLAKIKIKEEKKRKKKLLKTNKSKNKKKVVRKEKKNIQKKIKVKYVDTHRLCSDLNKCNIDEISEYLIKEGTSKEYPDITRY